MKELLKEYLQYTHNNESITLLHVDIQGTNIRCEYIVIDEVEYDVLDGSKVDISVWELLAFVNEKTNIVINELTKNTP